MAMMRLCGAKCDAMKYYMLPPELFAYNRERFVRKMSADSLAIFHSNDLMPRSGDTFFPFRQNSGLFYLCGIDQPETVLVLFPGCIKDTYQEVLFIKRTDEFTARWQGATLTREMAAHLSGVRRVHWLDEMAPIMHELILLAKRVYVNLGEHDRFFTEVPSRDMRALKQLQERYPAHKYHRAAPLLKKLMMIKSAWEVDLIRQAIDITGEAIRKVLTMVEPGVQEYEIEAEITAEFLRRRANGHAYAPIVASGPHTCTLHYTRNNRKCQNGDLLLLDIGAEYANYASDITRTIPVSGQFSPRQRQVYESVLRTFYFARSGMTPGITQEELQKEIGRFAESELVGLGLLHPSDLQRQNPEAPLYKQFFLHGASHHLGLDVHDPAQRYDPLQAGMVLTCEPGIYLPGENIGIRLENDILITDEGPVDLAARIPIEAEEIEGLMQSRAEGWAGLIMP
jgi:Xaa-Pro aminopeptidase